MIFLLYLMARSLSAQPLIRPAPPALIENGAARGVLVIPAVPTKAETFAAEEIQTYLQKMTGVQLPIKTTASESETSLLIGACPENREAKTRLLQTSVQNEAFALIPAQNHLSLVGNSDTALVYGAWEFLETQGVKWILPTERGSFVPRKSLVSLPPRLRIEAPGFEFRGPAVVVLPRAEGSEKFNSLEHGIPGSHLLSFRLKLNSNFGFSPGDVWHNIGNGHSYGDYLPPQKYFAAHPEWYALLNGKRSREPGQWQVCFTQERAAREFARNLIFDAENALQKRGWKEERLRFWVSPNDWKAECECEDCAKLHDTGGSVSSLVTLFANRVASEIAKVYPKSKVCFYAYDSYSRPPEKVRPGPNVAPEITFWTANTSFAANNAKPMLSESNHKFRDWFLQWANLSPGGVSVHGYYGHYVIFTPYPQVTQMANDFPRFAKMPRVYGITSEDHLHWGTQLPNFYLAAKLKWNPNLNVSKTLEEFYAAGFGQAAPFVRDYFSTLQARMDALAYFNGNVSEIPQILTPEVIARCSSLIGQAEAVLPRLEENTRWRTQVVIEGWKISVETANALTLYLHPADLVEDGKTLSLLIGSLQKRLDSDLGQFAVEKEVADAALRSTLKAVGTPLHALPRGQTTYNDVLNFGGAAKFKGRAAGLKINSEGYALAGGASGDLELPLRAAEEQKIVALTLRTGFAVLDPARLEIEIRWVSETGETVLLANTVKDTAGALTAKFSPASAGTLRISMKNLTAQEFTALAWLTATVSVQ